MQTTDTAWATQRLKVIDVDTHFSEPHDLWTKRAPAGARERVPQVKMFNGKKSWVIDGDKPIGIGASPASSISKTGEKSSAGLRHRMFQIEDVHPGSFAVKPRLAMMDQTGVWAQIVYPNIMGFGGQQAAKLDPALRLLCVNIYNDAMAEFQRESGDRLLPMALLPWWDVAESVKEAARCAAMGMRGVNINSDPHAHKDSSGAPLPDLGNPYWNPLWEVCVDRRIPINFHIGSSEPAMDWFGSHSWPSLKDDMRTVLGGCMLFFDNGRIMANLIASGLLDRFPKLRFVSVESGIGWIPFFLESLDYQYGELNASLSLQKRPSEYFQSNFHACFWFETKNLAYHARAIGIDNVMFETDFPHPSCLFPVDDALLALPGLTEEERVKVLSLNAARLYGVPI